jgi:hypothetical protein
MGEKFTLAKAVENERWHLNSFESSFYTLELGYNKEHSYFAMVCKKNDSNSRIPNVYIDSEEDTFKIEIQTTSYGALSTEDYQYFVKDLVEVQKYIEEMKELINNFMDKQGK